ncbi:acyltransferase family protein [Pseudonocardia sp. CA-107938]|uniref:acyltransferase family protein n=1 Tax=Pseudonocardia sp. CA-107938 TaxID=3240021 RepID=UPI003D9064D4
MTATAPGRAVPAAITGFAGLSVLLVALQSSGGFAVELLGPDLVLAVGGFVVTYTVLTAAGSSGAPVTARAWYLDQIGRHAPLLLLTLLGGLLAIALLGRAHQVGQAAIDGLGGALGVQNWVEIARAGVLPAPRAGLLAPHGDFYTNRLDLVDPFGTLWLISLLVQFTLAWPLVLCGLRWLVDARAGRTARLVPFVLALALLAAAAGVLRARSGADPTELAFGSHVRAAEWLSGATAGVVAAGLPRRAPARTGAWLLAALGVAGLVASAVAATLWRATWLTSGGPAAAAAAAAILLVALHLTSTIGGTAGGVGRGFPLELGRSAYPILLLHAPLFWLVQRAVPGARPFALIAVGVALAWVLGLLVQDGLLRRVRDRAARRGPGFGAGTALLAATVLAGAPVLYTLDERPLGSGTGLAILVLGGSSGSDTAAALAGSRFTVVDATRPGCGLLPEPPAPDSPARPTALAQAPQPAPACADQIDLWRTAVLTTRPAAVVLDLSADAAPRRGPGVPSSPCDPQFRTTYRSLVADAVGVLTTRAPHRPILVTTQDGTGVDARGGCLDALLVEAAMTHPAVVAFDTDGPLCPAGYCRTVGEPGAPRLGDGVHLSAAGIAALGRPLEERLAVELARARTPASTPASGTGCSPGGEEVQDGC